MAYTESNQPAAAAVEFEKIAQTPGEGPDVQREATLQAADLYDKAGNSAKSRAMLEAFVKHFPQPVDPAMEARNKLSTIAAKAGDTAARDYWLRDIVAADRAAGAARTDRSRALAAKATLKLASPVRDEFVRIKLVVPLKKSLIEKRKAMEAALKAYEQAADYQVSDVTTAATFESAELYRQLAKDLLSSERPKNLSKDELEQYNVLLEEQAFPFEEKAIKLHEVNVARAKDGADDEWIQKSFGALAQLNPGRYGKVEIGEQQVESIGAAAAVPVPVPAPGSSSAAAAGGGKAAVSVAVAPVAAAPVVPERAAQQYAQALQLMKSGRNTDAELEFKELAVEYPQLSGPQLNLGLLYLRDSRLPEAEAAFKAALEHEPANAVAGNELGIVERKLGKFTEAEAAYQRTIAAEPNYAPAHLNLGVLYDLYLAQPQKALEEFERYLEIAGDNKQVAGWVVELRKRVGRAGTGRQEGVSMSTATKALSLMALIGALSSAAAAQPPAPLPAAGAPAASAPATADPKPAAPSPKPPKATAQSEAGEPQADTSGEAPRGSGPRGNGAEGRRENSLQNRSARPRYGDRHGRPGAAQGDVYRPLEDGRISAI